MARPATKPAFSKFLRSFVAFAALSALAGAARAEDDEEGKRQYRRGQELIAAGDFAGAAAAFEAGHAASPRIGFLLNIGNCHRKLGELGKARQYYWRFLEGAPKNHPSRGEVIGYLRTIEQIEADGVGVDASPASEPPASSLPPPAIAFAPASPSRPAPRALPTALVEEPAPPPARVGSGGARWWVWTIVGGAVAAGAAAYAFGRGDVAPACRASLGCVRE